jgi:taurine--2-oxoglutarate transaminase
MTNKEIAALTKKYLVSDVSFPSSFDNSGGVYFSDIEGKRFLDFSSGYGVANIGWQHPGMIGIMQKQAGKSNYAPPWMISEESAKLGEALSEYLPDNDYKFFRATGGADANEIVLKVMFAKFGGAEVLSFYRSYHGGTHAALGISDIDAFRLPEIKKAYRDHKVEPPNCFRCPVKKNKETCSMECLNLVDDVLNKNPGIKVFMAEPVLGSGGVIVPPKNYFRQLAEICKKYEVALVMDEVLTGNGRTGYMLASEYYGIAPDAYTMAKGLASGYAAIGAAAIKDEHLESFYKYDDVSSSFAWTPMSCALALQNIQILKDEKLCENAKIQGGYLMENMAFLLNKKYPEQFGEVRGLGAMIGCEMVNNQTDKSPNKKLNMRILLGMLKRGSMWCASWDYSVMIALPPLCITRSECDEALDILEASL